MTRAPFRIVVAIVACLQGAQLLAAEVRAQIDRPTPQVAEPFWMTVVVRAPEAANVQFPEIPETLGEFRVVAHRDWFDVPVGAQREWTRHLQLESLQGGEFEIPPQVVSVDGETLQSSPIAVTIPSSIEADAVPFTFRDIKPPIDIPAPEDAKPSPWAIACVAAGVLVAATGLAIAWTRRRKRPIKAGAWALQELEHLRRQSTAPPQAPALVAAVGGVLREYIERQLEIRATRQTTEEFLATARQEPRLSEQQRGLLQEFLELVDEVKFAHRQLSSHRVDDSFRLVEEFVRATSGDLG